LSPHRGTPHRIAALLLALSVAGCAPTPERTPPPGTSSCESFFIYVLCIADLDADQRVDYMYFDDTREIFMYEASMAQALGSVLPFHACAIPMSRSTRDYSSQLLYDETLSIADRLRIKGQLILNYRAAQPAVDACNTNSAGDQMEAPEPFLTDEDWDEGAL
jgi:hypothetical protein